MNEPAGGWALKRLYGALREMITGPHFLKQLQNHCGVELRDVKRTYRHGSFDVVEMKNGDTYGIKFRIFKQTFNDSQSNRDSEIQP